MNFLRAHRFWMAAFIFAVVLMLSSAPLLRFLRDEAGRHRADLQNARAKTEQSLRQLEDDRAATEKLNGQIGAAEVEKSLAPVNRLQAADRLEHQAADARLDHFAYTLSPEQKITVSSPEAGMQELAVSTIAVKADAPLDTDVWAFVERVHALLPGRLRLQDITLEKIGAGNAPLVADNIRLTANFEWLSNGVAKEMAEGW